MLVSLFPLFLLILCNDPGSLEMNLFCLKSSTRSTYLVTSDEIVFQLMHIIGDFLGFFISQKKSTELNVLSNLGFKKAPSCLDINVLFKKVYFLFFKISPASFLMSKKLST